MDAVTDPTIEEIVVMKSAQVGWTEILCNVVGYIIDRDPSPILLLQPTETMAETWSKDRLSPMVRDTPCLAKLFSTKSRHSGNTILHKQFPGGHLTLVGANAPSGLASRPIRWVLNDEVDRYPASAGAEGDPISLAKKRTQTFVGNRKILSGSTPTVKGTSRIELAFDQSDKRYYMVPCPHCGGSQRLKWANVQWPEGEPEKAYYVCEFCGVCLQETDRHRMVRNGKWVATAPFKGIAGFHISELYSPWSTWAQMAVEFLRAKKNPQTLKTWVNTSLGETWEDAGEKIEADALLARREHYSTIVPANVLLLTAGVDVQGDRLECEVAGWGHDDESWSIDYRIFYGSPSLPDVWRDLDHFLTTQKDHEYGLKIKISSVCVDSGGNHTEQVYKFTKARQHRRVYSIKGSSTPGSPAVGRASKKNKGGAILFPVGTDTIKEEIYSFLKITKPGAGYCHFSVHHNDDEYFNQLTAEEVKVKYVKGIAVRYFENKPGKRNEALDCRVYATAARYILNPNYSKLAKLYEMPEEEVELPVDPSEEALIEKPAVKPKNKKKSKTKGGGFVNRW